MEAFFLVSLFFTLLHGKVPIHYFLVLFPFIIIFGAKIIIKLKFLGILVLSVLTIISCKYFTVDRHCTLVPYAQQLQVVDAIINDAQGRHFELKRWGMFEEFDANFAQNYQYLLWWKGNEPVKDSDLVYTIYEKTPPTTGSNIIFSIPDLWVTRTLGQNSS